MEAKNNKKEHNNSEDINISIDQARRFQIIEQCLKNNISSVLDLQIELESHNCGATSTSTIKHDLGDMRRLDAPIKSIKQKYYTYSDKSFSIKKFLPQFFTPAESEQLSASIVFLKQIQSHPLFEELEQFTNLLLKKYNLNTNMLSVVGFDHIDVIGTNYFPDILNYIIQKQCISIKYHPYNKDVRREIMSPYYLKQYNHRWYVLGLTNKAEKHDSKHVTILALDRIESICITEDFNYIENPGIDFETFFDDIYGVTHFENSSVEIIKLRVDESYLGYFETRPLHKKQIPKRKLGPDRIVTIPLQCNIELQNKLMTIADSVEVLEPAHLRNKIIERLETALEKQRNAMDD